MRSAHEILRDLCDAEIRVEILRKPIPSYRNVYSSWSTIADATWVNELWSNVALVISDILREAYDKHRRDSR